MNPGQRVSRILVLLVVTAALCTSAVGYGDPARRGPLVSYEPGGEPLADVGLLAVQPRVVADFDTYLVNTSGHPVHVIGAWVIALPGHPAPRLVHVARERGRNRVGIQRGWPPSGVAPLRLVGSSVPAGLVKIAVGITGTEPGTSYPTPGVVVSFRDHGRTRRVIAWGGGVACVVTTKRETDACLGPSPGVTAALQDYIHAHG